MNGLPLFVPPPLDSVAPPFDHPACITNGYGRVIYAGETTDARGKHYPEGWVLPGGERTLDFNRANAVAHGIDDATHDALPASLLGLRT